MGKWLFPMGLLAVVAAAGCSASPNGGKSADTPTCGVYLAGHDARVIVRDGKGNDCADLAKQLSSSGDFWTLQEQATSDASLSVMCVMTRAGRSATVEDTGSAIYGTDLCRSLLTSGWAEDTTGEQSVQQSAAASAAASAVASAAASAAGKLASDQAAVARDIAGLRSDSGGFASDQVAMANDLVAEKKDLAIVRKEAAGGQGDVCDNAVQVGSDATTVQTDATTIGTDADTIETDAVPVQDDLKYLQDHVQALSADPGGVVPVAASGAAAVARTAIAEAVAIANHGVDEANSIAVTATHIAAGLATGSCQGTAPDVPEPVPHIH